MDFNPLSVSAKIISTWPPRDELVGSAGHRLGAICYSVDALEQETQLQTLVEIYQRNSFNKIEAFLQILFDENLAQWYTEISTTNIRFVRERFNRITKNSPAFVAALCQ